MALILYSEMLLVGRTGLLVGRTACVSHDGDWEGMAVWTIVPPPSVRLLLVLGTPSNPVYSV